ncbi:glycosyltransferase family 2 protein [Niveibacterium umoris]|uniref:Glycosyl transferase n=1 Tax=Niveibacterium umoris TaxID=1193620 RepID=A0A840BKY2_9RHOO|nr:glycosyltransferase family 2 protein [Niveibacterium umoris]MBB4012228.1 hypothetical protein [Niveibacterium umoris]
MIARQQLSRLAISIVIYRPDAQLLAQTVASVLTSAAQIPDCSTRLVLVSNDDGSAGARIVAETSPSAEVLHLSGHGNVGYGAGHNMALHAVESDFHLILNPDVVVDTQALAAAVDFMRHHPDVVMLSPDARCPTTSGRLFLCRRMPRWSVLFARGFVPARFRRRLRPALDHYEMRDVLGDTLLWDPPLVSGCFMLARTHALREIRGFDERYFLYFEDYDLSLRLRSQGRIVWHPSVRIWHSGGGAAKKGLRHQWMFVRSALRFRKKWGLPL